MRPPTRRGGVLELQLSICPRTSCLARPMTIAMYQQFRSWIPGITTYRTEDTTGHNLIHALSIRAGHLPPSCPTRFPDCVGLVPNSTATTLRTVKASGTGLSFRSTGHSGLGTNSPHAILLSLYIIPQVWYQHISVSSPVTYSHRSPLGFYSISRLEDDQLKLPRTSCNRWFSFVRIFPSHLGILFSYSACPIRNSSRPFQRTYPSCPPAAQFFSYPSSTASISHVIFIPLLTARPRSPAFVVRGCLPSAHLAGTTAAPVGRIRGRLLQRCIRRSSNCIWFAFPHPLSVFVPCFFDVLPCASRLCLSYTYDVYALISLGLLLRIGDSFLTRSFLLAT
jgi:hypothetical protein